MSTPENTGLVILGTCDDGIPTDKGVAFPPAAGGCKVHIKYKSGSKTKKASAAGKSGAKTTYTGKNVGELEIDIDWLDDGEDITAQVEAALAIISPAGAHAGKAWDYSERWAGLHGIGAVMIEDFNGPNPSKNSNEVTCNIKASGWTKPINSGAGAATTPTTATAATTPPTGALVNMPTSVAEMKKVVDAGGGTGSGAGQRALEVAQQVLGSTPTVTP